MKDDLLGLGERIERLATSAVGARFLDRLERPLLRAMRWKPKVRIDKLILLAPILEAGTATAAELLAAYEPCQRELAKNVETAERLHRFSGRVPTAHATWLRRSYEVCFRTKRAIDAMDRRAFRAIAAQAGAVVPPLGTRDTAPPAVPEAEALEYSLVLPSLGEEDANDTKARAVEIELAAIDHLLEAARAESRTIERKRKLLQAARERLLDAQAAMPLDPKALRDRRLAITRDLTVLDRLQAAGLSPRTNLLHQARQALAEGDRARLYAALRGIDEAALAAGDDGVLSRSTDALNALDGPLDPAASLRASAKESFGAAAVEAVKRGYARGRAALDDKANSATIHYFDAGSDAKTYAAALAVDACFELGGALTPVRLEEEERRIRIVPYPTPALHLVPANAIEDVPHGVITDPRSILMDLAAGRLLARRYVQEERIVHTKNALATEIRLFVLDGSGSMLGARSRMRDAMLVAELSTLAARLAKGGFVRPRLLFRFFDTALHKLTRVATEAEALTAIENVLAETHDGGTDIELALTDSFAEIKRAREKDKDLARAQIVLVTDGDAPVDKHKILRAQGAVGDLAIGVSVVALGMENEALRDLVAEQRKLGRAAFYHFVSDEELELIASGKLNASFSLHLAKEDSGKSRSEIARSLSQSVGALVEELAELERSRDVAKIEQAELERRSLHELEAIGEASISEGERARFEAAQDDERALRSRFERWFGHAEAPATDGDPSPEDAENVRTTLAAVLEIVDLVGGTELERKAEAIELFERLLPDAGVTPGRFRAVRDAKLEGVEKALEELRRVTTPTSK